MLYPYSAILYQVEQRVAYITLNRPDKRNAFNPDLIADLKAAFSQAEADPEVRVVVLRANGKVFSAGADLGYLKSLSQNTEEQNTADSQSLADLFHQMYIFPKIVIAQVEGHAIAGGCGLATVCDLVFAVPEAMFGYTEVQIGFVPAIVMVFLIRKIGETKARELLLSGNLVTAQEAMSIGLINVIEPDESIDEVIRNYTQRLCNTTSPDAIRLTKSMIAQVQAMPIAEALTYAATMNAKARTTDDFKRGINAFLNKERITW